MKWHKYNDLLGKAFLPNVPVIDLHEDWHPHQDQEDEQLLGSDEELHLVSVE